MIDRLVALVAFVPVGLNRLVHAAVPALRDRSVVVPVALGLLLLAAVPFTHAGLELVTTRAVPSEVIERRVGGATMLEVVGEAIDTGLPAGTDARGRPLRWLALRDGPDRRSVLLVRTPESPADLRTRAVTARVRIDEALVARVDEALAERGARGAPGAGAAATTLGGRYLVEEPDAADAQEVDGPAEIASLADGTVVRVELRLSGDGIATCTLDGTCDARAVAAGEGRWLHRATATTASQAVLVETTYPPPVFLVDLIGEQVREPATVDALTATRPARMQLGWVRVLRAALLDHDPELPIDRDWRGVLVLVGAAGLLLLARRRPYPVFRHEADGRWTRAAPATAVEGRALGHLAVGDGPPVEAHELPLRIVPGGPGDGPRVMARLPSGEVELEVPASGVGVSGLERGRLAWVRHSRPALWLHWYRTDLRVAFATEADRDAAAASLAPIATPPVPPIPPAAPPPPPRRRAPSTVDDDEPRPTWRRPRPRGVR